MPVGEFVAKWRAAGLKERSAAQEHFLDLCRVLGEATPAEADPTGERYCFEKGARKEAGGQWVGRRLEAGLLRMGVQDAGGRTSRTRSRNCASTRSPSRTRRF